MEFLAKMKILIEMEIFDEQPKFYEINFLVKKIEFVVRNRNATFANKHLPQMQFWPKIEIFVKNRNFGCFFGKF